MESTVTIKTDEEKAEKLFDNHKTYNIRYLVRNHGGKYRATVVHEDYIGKQNGVFSYESFLETFDRPFMQDSGEYITFAEDIDFIRKGLMGGLTPRTVSKALKIYGSKYCKEDKYVKDAMNCYYVKNLIKEIKDKEKQTEFSR